jgi:8-oxo-dGTP pyrophosphatase MutT (NUDIX family)
MLQKWIVNEEKTIFKSFPFNVVEKQYIKPDQDKFKAYILQMPDWVNIIGIDSENKILLIKQFRFGTDLIELEIPGGIIESDEKPKEAASRELEEETGYKVEPKNLKQIGVVDANPAIQTNKCYTFLAENISPSGKINFDEDEIIEHEFFTPNQVREFIRSGKITNSYIITAFHWLALCRELE